MSPALLTHEAVSTSAPTNTMLLETLHDALVTERRLLEDLTAQMRRQRSAVSTDDIQGVDDTTFATHRILATLGQARQRRRQINLLLGATEECSLRDLEELLGDQVDARLREARQRLQQAADLLAREVGMNRKLLREALAANDAQVRTLMGATATPSTYAAAGSSPGAPASGVLVNRTA